MPEERQEKRRRTSDRRSLGDMAKGISPATVSCKYKREANHARYGYLNQRQVAERRRKSANVIRQDFSSRVWLFGVLAPAAKLLIWIGEEHGVRTTVPTVSCARLATGKYQYSVLPPAPRTSSGMYLSICTAYTVQSTRFNIMIYPFWGAYYLTVFGSIYPALGISRNIELQTQPWP